MFVCGYGCYCSLQWSANVFVFAQEIIHCMAAVSTLIDLNDEETEIMLLAECQLQHSIVLLIAVDFVDKRCEQTPLIW